jgi:hypothetical protein
MEHGHDISGCDLIICWYDDLPLSPVPTLELGNFIEAPDEPEEPNEFVAVYDPGKHIKSIEMWETPQDTLKFRFGWYLRENEVIAHKSPNVPVLNQSEFTELFKQIDKDAREEAFVDLEFDSLKTWYDSLPEASKIKSDRKGRILASLVQGVEGEKVLKLMEDSYINISQYLESGKQHPGSQNAAAIDEQAFRGVLGQIPREVREQVFLELNLEALWNWHQQ